MEEYFLRIGQTEDEGEASLQTEFQQFYEHISVIRSRLTVFGDIFLISSFPSNVTLKCGLV